MRNLTAFDNEFDGLACYQTRDCLFTGLYLHDNPGAGISLDLGFQPERHQQRRSGRKRPGRLHAREPRQPILQRLHPRQPALWRIHGARRAVDPQRLGAGSPDRVRAKFLHQPGGQRLRRRGLPRQQRHLHEQCHHPAPGSTATPRADSRWPSRIWWRCSESIFPPRPSSSSSIFYGMNFRGRGGSRERGRNGNSCFFNKSL